MSYLIDVKLNTPINIPLKKLQYNAFYILGISKPVTKNIIYFTKTDKNIIYPSNLYVIKFGWTYCGSYKPLRLEQNNAIIIKTDELISAINLFFSSNLSRKVIAKLFLYNYNIHDFNIFKSSSKINGFKKNILITFTDLFRNSDSGLWESEKVKIENKIYQRNKLFLKQASLFKTQVAVPFEIYLKVLNGEFIKEKFHNQQHDIILLGNYSPYLGFKIIQSVEILSYLTFTYEVYLSFPIKPPSKPYLGYIYI